jgi:anti-sigma B factor antagonist
VDLTTDAGRIVAGRRDGVVLVTLLGEHDLSNRDALRTALADALAEGARVVVNMSRVDFIDSSVLHALVWAGRRAQTQGHTIVVCAPAGGFVWRLLHTTGLLGVLRVAEAGEDAPEA